MAGRIELPFLYHTRTILGRSGVVLNFSRRLVSSQQGVKVSAGSGSHSPSPEQETVVRAKAHDRSWAPLAGKPTANGSESDTTISSTITPSERRAFEAILRFAPKQDEPKSVKPRSPHQDAVDTDIDTILKIFTSSVRDYESKLDATRGNRRAVESQDAEARTKHPVRPASGRKATSRAPARIDQKEQPKPHTAEQIHAEPLSTHLEDQLRMQATEEKNDEPRLWSAFGRREEPGQVPLHGGNRSLLGSEPERESSALNTITISAASTVNSTALLAGQPIKDVAQDDSVDQYLLQTAPPSQTSAQLEASVQSAVRARMHSLSAALSAAATSTSQRGDTAMWEVVEAQIFSLAKHFQPQITQQPRNEGRPFGGISKFTFSREKSENPIQMIEAAERTDRITNPPASGSATATGSAGRVPNGSVAGPNPDDIAMPAPTEPLSQDDLQILQHVYPASLLLALRLYITHFPSSPYAFLLLPRIRALGTTSYVLGASPQFYNSLMSLVWLVRSSLREVDGLLGEMERGGVEMDEGTYAVLGAIEEARNADFEREKGTAGAEMERTVTADTDADATRGAAWWQRQEQMLFFPRVLDWLDVIAGRLAAKERASVV
ncbi:hypothetical protein PV04_04772 [Phialophora macrospora]|uniref:Mtf2-like C-terminal domain-containing protein n=1 Tax=Phialophora macrospora TaxID=1851006 RepID=A0A0D2FQM5_9EURO|nr:hypothetical protein PV04_04772 [Phialophora macrospora]